MRVGAAVGNESGHLGLLHNLTGFAVKGGFLVSGLETGKTMQTKTPFGLSIPHSTRPSAGKERSIQKKGADEAAPVQSQFYGYGAANVPGVSRAMC